jgi:hypothetical protein
VGNEFMVGMFRRFDVVAFLPSPLSDFWRFASPVKDRRFLDIARAGPGRRIFGGVP